MVGYGDAFVTVLEPGQAERGNQLVYSTYFDGNATAIAAGPNGNAYIYGGAAGDLTLRHAFDTKFVPNTDAFLAVFDPSESGDDSLVYSTYIGGSGDENGTVNDGGVAVGPNGVALVTGRTGSFDFPVTPEGLRVFP